jgi:excisionase family DNA binding protein
VSTGDQRLTITVDEAAKLLGVGRSMAYEAARRGELPIVRMGRRVLVSRAGLLRLIEGTSRD